MKPDTFTKNSWEKRKLEFDVINALASGDSVASISAVTVWRDSDSVETTSTMLSGTPSKSGNKVYANIQGGTDGVTYRVRVRVITTNGDYIEDTLHLVVSDAGG